MELAKEEWEAHFHSKPLKRLRFAAVQARRTPKYTPASRRELRSRWGCPDIDTVPQPRHLSRQPRALERESVEHDKIASGKSWPLKGILVDFVRANTKSTATLRRD